MEITNKFKGLYLVDRVPEELWTEVHDIVQETGSRTIPKKKKCSLGISNFLEEISSFFPLFCFPLFICIVYLRRPSYLSLLFYGTLHSNGYLSFSALLFASLLFTAICKASSDNHIAFLPFFFLEMVLIPAYSTVSQSSVHTSSGTLSIRSSPLNLFLTSTV